MGFDELLYQLSNYSTFNFNSLNELINGFLDKFQLAGISLSQEIAALWRSAVCSICILAVMFLPKIGGNLLMTLIYKIIFGVVIYLLSSYVLNYNTMKALLTKIIRKLRENR